VLLENGRSPSRRAGELDNRGSHFYLALYWARELASQTEDAPFAERFAATADQLGERQEQIAGELLLGSGEPVDLGGYYRPDAARVEAVMRPSATLAGVLAALRAGA
jgi:isocitrate dehydrogenase